MKLTTLDCVLLANKWEEICNKMDKREGIYSLPIKVQWTLVQNMKQVNDIKAQFETFKQNANDAVAIEFLTEDRAVDKVKVDETGAMSVIKEVKEEYQVEYHKALDRENAKLKEFAMVEHDLDIKLLDVDELILELDRMGNHSITVPELEFLYIFNMRKEKVVEE